jgi:hypothetical protein
MGPAGQAPRRAALQVTQTLWSRRVILGFGLVCVHRPPLSALDHASATVFYLHKVGRCSLLLASLHLSFSPCRTVRPLPASPTNVTNWGNPLCSISRAPRGHNPMSRSAFSKSRGAAVNRQACVVHNHVCFRQEPSSALVSGAAAPGAVSGKARRRAHGPMAPAPFWGPKSFVTRPASAGTH